MLGSCFVICLALGLQYWSLLAFGCSQVLVLSRRPLGNLSLTNIPWIWKYSGYPKSNIWVSHHGSSVPTSGWSLESLKTTQDRKKKKKNKQTTIITTTKKTHKTPRQIVKAKLNWQKHTKHTITLTKGKEEKKQKEENEETKERAVRPVNKPINENKY